MKSCPSAHGARGGQAAGEALQPRMRVPMLPLGPESVEPTNNIAERALRPAVLWRKGSLGSDSERGTRFAERRLTVVATCRQQGRRLLDFLVAAVDAALRRSSPPSLLPAGGGLNGYGVSSMPAGQ